MIGVGQWSEKGWGMPASLARVRGPIYPRCYQTLETRDRERGKIRLTHGGPVTLSYGTCLRELDVMGTIRWEGTAGTAHRT